MEIQQQLFYPVCVPPNPNPPLTFQPPPPPTPILTPAFQPPPTTTQTPVI